MRSPGWIVKVVCAAIPARHKNLALIVGIDESDEIAEHDAMLVTESRSRQDDRRVARVAQMNCDA